jgi:hypothetical protein
MIRKMARETMFGKTDQSISVIFKMTIAMVMAKCIGRMVAFIKESGLMEFRKIQ